MARALAAARSVSVRDDRAPRATLEERLEAMQRRFPANAHRLGQLVTTANGRASVIRDANVIETGGVPSAYVYRTRDATFLLQRDLSEPGALRVMTEPARDLPRHAIAVPMRASDGASVAGSHVFLPSPWCVDGPAAAGSHRSRV